MKTDDTPGQEDFGWYLNFYVSGMGHTFVIGYRPAYEDAEETWIAWLERRRGFIGSMFGARERGIDPFAAETLHKIFVGSPQIRNLRWHFQRDFRKGATGHAWIGEKDIFQGPKQYKSVDGILREEVCLTYEVEKVSGFPLNQINVTYSGQDARLAGRANLSLTDVKRILREWGY